MVFLAGVAPNMRSEVWPFLLDCYDYNLTRVEREKVRRRKRKAYEKIKAVRCVTWVYCYDDDGDDYHDYNDDGINCDGNVMMIKMRWYGDI